MWADKYITQLKSRMVVKFRPKGNSMVGLISSGQLVTVVPFVDEGLDITGSVVLCKVNGRQYLHKVLACKNGQYQIGNNKGGINGWTSSRNIYGVVAGVEP